MKINIRQPKIGDVVAFNLLYDATWFDVLEINGNQMIVREHGTNYSRQLTDKSLVKQFKEITK